MKKQHHGRPLEPLGPGAVYRLVVNMSRAEAVSIRAAAKRAKMPVATWVRSIIVPIALNALADVADKSRWLDKIKQETKVAEHTFDVD